MTNEDRTKLAEQHVRDLNIDIDARTIRIRHLYVLGINMLCLILFLQILYFIN